MQTHALFWAGKAKFDSRIWICSMPLGLFLLKECDLQAIKVVSRYESSRKTLSAVGLMDG